MHTKWHLCELNNADSEAEAFATGKKSITSVREISPKSFASTLTSLAWFQSDWQRDEFVKHFNHAQTNIQKDCMALLCFKWDFIMIWQTRTAYSKHRQYDLLCRTEKSSWIMDTDFIKTPHIVEDVIKAKSNIQETHFHTTLSYSS